MDKRSIFKFERREGWRGTRPVYKTLATFPSFDLAWKAANDMFTAEGYNITGCHVDPGDGISFNPEANFLAEDGNTLEEYRISELLGDNDNE